MADYMPRSDGEFNGWQANFVSYATAHLAELGLAAGDLTPITTAQTAWTGSYTAHLAAQAAAQAARTTKDGNRTALETLIRALVRRLQASPQVSDGERAALGITVPDREPTPVGAPTTRPLASVDAAQRLRHVIDFSDEASPTSKAKPAGVIGAEIWVKVGGTPPVDPGELTFLAVDTRTPYTANYSGSDGGQPAHYMLRWVNSRGETGPWSETITATIGA
ncbi:MAG: hypothetical protein HJJLKODD_02059 [Phycisphaerae bacterium]|nr:hypothetical protein [Phycisphaerae bacterium]